MPSPLRLSGTIASRGFAEGPLQPLAAAMPLIRTSGSPTLEAQALRAAKTRAVAELKELAAATQGPGADMLEFQVAMLDDDALTESTFASIASGVSAGTAWTATLGEQIEIYKAAEDEYFRARSADLIDIRDRVLRALSKANEIAVRPGAILAGDDLTPSQFLAVDWARGGGIALRRGSAASHVAMLARSRGVPMLVGLEGLPLAEGETALIDAEEGSVTIGPTDEARARFRRRASAGAGQKRRAEAAALVPGRTIDGTDIAVAVNVADPDDLSGVDVRTCDGVGLMRTEFLYGRGLPDEETQLAAYRRVVHWAEGRPVVIRTVDAGGDKPVVGFTIEETNPFLGLRGIRLALAKPEIFRVQIRALLRVAAEGEVRVMFPMISVAAEYEAAKALFLEEAQALATRAVQFAMPRLGIMVEVPAVAICPELLSGAAFFSIGSNDLTQYALAASRDNGAVAGLNDVRHPAVLSLIGNLVRFGQQQKLPVSLCGDAGGDPAALPDLLATGLRNISVAPAQLPLAKLTLSQLNLGAGT
jgi:phosphoenolpyruvate-protein phosphotransferase (PTS system enzyme I)